MATSFRNNDRFDYDYAIVGGGSAGASTALAFQLEWPDKRIIWFEGTETQTASKKDNVKIIRTPYPDDDYVALAEKAMKLWREDVLYRDFYYQPGWVQVISEGSYRSTRKTSKDRKISTEEMLEMLHMVGSFNGPVLDDGEELWLNEDIGAVYSDLALEAVANKASMLGVARKKINVTKLIVNEGVCEGVEAVTDDKNYSFTAETTIIAAGVWTPGLLEISGVVFPKDFFTVAGVVVAMLPLEDGEFDKFESMPILVSEKGLLYYVNLILSQLTSDR
jgi:sarcosine oxidase/L-pipecolate oxidase